MRNKIANVLFELSEIACVVLVVLFAYCLGSGDIEKTTPNLIMFSLFCAILSIYHVNRLFE